MRSRRTLVATIYLFVCWAESSPQDYFPINSQLPPVARISEPFSFIFSASTFSSPHPMSYSLVHAPGWLSIDSSSRRLFGEPKEEDVPPGKVVGVPIELQAKDKSGTTTTNATLVVSRNPSPKVKIPLAAQAQRFGPFSLPSSLLLHPSKPFAYTFDRNTFQADGASELDYYAVSGDNAPLPSWISFNPKNLSFTGATPPFESLVQPPQTFDVQLVASDVFGFAAVPLKFSLVVGTHELASTSPSIALNATRGQRFEYTGLVKTVKLDNRPIRPEEVKSITISSLPSWLAIDHGTWGLSGTPGQTATASNITVSLQDTFLDTVNITLAVHILPGLFRQNFTDLNVTAGTSVSVDVKTFLWDPPGVEQRACGLMVGTGLIKPFISGTVPTVQDALDSVVTVTATSKSSKQKETRTILIHIDPGDIVSTNTDIPAPTAAPTAEAHSKQQTGNAPLLALLLPLLLVLLIAAIVVLLCLHRRNRKAYEGGVTEVSAPIPGSFVRHDTSGPENGLWHTMFDIGPSRRRRKRRHASHSAVTPNTESPATSFTGSSQDSLNDHPVTYRLVALRSSDGSHISSLDQRRMLDPAVPLPLRIPTVARSGDSLLSDTSIDEDENDTARRDFGLGPGRVENERSNIGYLDMPMIHEPLSIQNTPEIAYRTWSDGGSSVELAREDIGVALSGNRDSTWSTRGIGRRVSRAWKQGTASRLLEEYKRKSNQTTSSSQTARTSPLTTGIAAERPVNANAISKPTIVHIPSRPGEVRQISRRVGGSSPLFSGGSTTNSPRTLTPITQSASSTNSDLQRPLPALQTFTAMSRDSDTSWDRIARDSLGIAYKDLKPPVKPTCVVCNTTGQAQDNLNWSNRNSRNLVSPNQWLRPQMNSSAEGMGLPRAAPRLSLYPSAHWAVQGE
ncbi:hypothetical protein PG993_005156 [Apiospora rasikravindrae]|uniref:Dystroglycan-type cadherin-like domain-containing protein n=1 Tax=Apiospora rasikravindrae TaxID=990691 RepID=A0ABR1TEW2_9PEZI